MQALVRVQARVRARRVRMALESQTAEQKLQQQLVNEAHVREIEVSKILYLYLSVAIMIEPIEKKGRPHAALDFAYSYM